MARKAKTTPQKQAQSALTFDRPVNKPAAQTQTESLPPPPPPPKPARVYGLREAWILWIWKAVSERAECEKILSVAPDLAKPNVLLSLAEYWSLIVQSIEGLGTFDRMEQCATYAEVAAMREGPTASFRVDPHMGARETMFRLAAVILRWRARNADGDAPLPVMRHVKNLVARSTERVLLEVNPMPSDQSLVIRVRSRA